MNEKSIMMIFIICSLLFAGCSNLMNSPSGEISGNNDLTPGMGYLSLRIAGESVERTIMPVTPGLSGLKYELAFYTPNTNNRKGEPLDRDFAGLSDIIELESGFYDLVVLAYKDQSKTLLVARGEVKNIKINADGGTDCEIRLKAINNSGSAEGTFTWNFNIIFDHNKFSTMEEYLGAQAIRARVSVRPLDSNYSPGAENVLFPEAVLNKNNLLISEPLPVGFYNVQVNIKKTDAKDISINDILYIYQNMESRLDVELSEEFFNRNRYTVTLDYDDGETDQAILDLRTRIIDHAASSLSLPGSSEMNAVNPGYIFDDWYTSNGSLWIGLANDARVKTAVRDFTLYAKWWRDLGATEITVTSSQVYNGFEQIPSYTVKYGEDTLTLDTHFTASYENNTEASGSAIITITGIEDGGYAGTNTKTFTIAPQPISSAAVDMFAPATGISRHDDETTIGESEIRFTLGTLEWDPDDDPFHGDTIYTTSVTLIAAANYTFSGGLMNANDATINGENADVTENEGATVKLSYTFGKTSTHEVTGIEIKSQPTKLAGYTHGDTLDLSGLVVTLSYSDGEEEDVAVADFAANNITTFPSNNTALSYSAAYNGIPIEVRYTGVTPEHTSGNLSISQKTLTIISAVHTKVYNGNTNVPGINAAAFSLSGIMADADGGNTVTVTSVTAAYTSPNAGTTTINISAASLTGDAADNYTLTLPANISATGTPAGISARPLSISGATHTKVYDGLVAASGAIGLTFSNIVASNDVYATNVTGEYADINVGADINITGYDLAGVDSGNYSVLAAENVPVSAGITPRALTITDAAHTKEYDGDKSANRPTVTLDGILSPGGTLDNVSPNYVDAEYQSAAAGTTLLDILSVSLTGGASGNYTVTPRNGLVVAGITHQVIPSVAITGITAPVVAGTPVKSSSGTGNFTGTGSNSVSWTPDDSPFRGSTAYTASVTLTALSNFTFTGLSAATINQGTGGGSADISNNTGTTVTLSYTFPATGSKAVSSIAVETQPAKLIYDHNDPLDLTGLEVKLIYNDGTSEVVGISTFGAPHPITTDPEAGDPLQHAVHNGEPVTVTYAGLPSVSTSNLTVNPATITGIASIKTPPQLTYTHGDPLDLSAMVVTCNYNDGISRDVTFANFTANNITTNIANNTTLAYSTHNGLLVTVRYNADTPVNVGNLSVNLTSGVTGIVVTVVTNDILAELEDIGGGPLTLGTELNPIRVSRSGSSVSNPPDAFTITVGNPGSYSPISWMYGGTILNSNAASYKLEAINFPVQGPTYLTLVVHKNGVPFSARIYFEVVN